MPETRTFLIDRCHLCRDCLRVVLDAHAFPVVGVAGDLEEAHARLGNGLEPGLILFDYDENEPRALEALPRVREAADTARVVLLACRFSLPKLRRALAAGADTGLGKTVAADNLLHYLQLVMAGEKVFPGEMAQLLLDTRTEGELKTPNAGVNPLSPREVQILRRLVEGESNKEIARILRISQATVKVHLRSLCRKINAANRIQAVRWAVENSILTESDALGG